MRVKLLVLSVLGMACANGPVAHSVSFSTSVSGIHQCILSTDTTRVYRFDGNARENRLHLGKGNRGIEFLDLVSNATVRFMADSLPGDAVLKCRLVESTEAPADSATVILGKHIM